jgi:hypothetical protein
MDETSSRDRRVIRLDSEASGALARALQWPEDLKRWDALHAPTNLPEIGI